jgi:hypothetical protein
MWEFYLREAHLIRLSTERKDDSSGGRLFLCNALQCGACAEQHREMSKAGVEDRGMMKPQSLCLAGVLKAATPFVWSNDVYVW